MVDPTATLPPDLDVAAWLDRPAPVVTAVLDATSAVEQAADRLRLQWQAACDDADPAVPAPVAQAVADRLTEPGAHAGGPSLLVLADGAGDVELVGMPAGTDRSRAWVGELPRLVPLLHARQGAVAHLVVVVDRVGADIVVVPADGDAERDVVDGATEHIHRGAPGGWSQRRFQQRAENTWEANATAVVEEVEARRAEVGARVVVVAGDVRAVQLLVDHAPAALLDALVVVEGAGRSDPDRFAAIDDEVRRQVATVAARATRDLLERFVELRAKELAVDGADAVLELLAEARVATLLVHDDPDDGRTAALDRDGGLVAAEAATLEQLGRPAVPARLVDAAVWAAWRTGADVHVVPGAGPNAPAGGLGALLRG